MNLTVTAKCTASEKDEGGDTVEFQSQKSDPDDSPGSYQVDAEIKLTIEKPELQGLFEVGGLYTIGLTIDIAPEKAG